MAQRRIHGPAVRVIRERSGIRHGVFAERVGISAPYLTNIERGIRQPAAGIVVKIAEALGVTLDEITYSTEEAA